MNNIENEINSRRTFAIISHPDAGKTTLTEKMLLYGGAIELAGSVTAKKKQKDTSSDWMELEKKRGISISSTVLQFNYRGFKMNLLDTPGHKDFSEDTYRVLMAVDAVVMVIDAGKGIESQTLKLFEICKKRAIPIFTFINKMDRPALPTLELLDQIEKVLDIQVYPVCWPLESGPFFKGVYNRLDKSVSLYEKVPGGAYKSPVSVHGIQDDVVRNALSASAYQEITEEIELLDIAHERLEKEEVLSGKTTPLFFGSAANNFGIELFLDFFLDFSGKPVARKAGNVTVPVEGPVFSAFVFKIQTNMNPQHRDRMVFARVCSGRFYKDIAVYNTRNCREVKISYSHSIFGRERETANEAYPGDIIGFITNSDFQIGDTISSDPGLSFNEIPRFAPECFAYISNRSTSGYKSFRKGLDHLLAEDIVQAFHLDESPGSLPLLGAVGPLQFEVMQYRLRDEYDVEINMEMKQWSALRWLDPESGKDSSEFYMPNNCCLGKDDRSRPVLLFQNTWSMQYFQEKNPEVILHDTPAMH